MKNFSFILALYLAFGFAPLSADTNTDIKISDMEMIFASSHDVNVIVLSEEEMQNTAGEVWWHPIAIGVGIGALKWGYNCA